MRIKSNSQIMNTKNCVISAVGKDSLHKMWTKGNMDFDFHLIVYDDSLELFRNDTKNIYHIKGFKLKIIYKYFETNPQLKDAYDYFFFPDDDIRMDAATINALFDAMRRYDLKIAQPALRMSYYSWLHTLYDRYSHLRYTNFVEMMVPCFSREALQKVLFTFNENETGWGTETHWPLLIDTTQRDMAIIDEVRVEHTRPIQSGQDIHKRDLSAYLLKYGLRTNVCIYDVILAPVEQMYCCDRATFSIIRAMILHWIRCTGISTMHIGEDGYLGYVHLLFLLTDIAQSRKCADVALDLLAKTQDGFGTVKNDMSFLHGFTGCCWMIEYLVGEKLLKVSVQEILADADAHIMRYLEEHADGMTLAEWAGIGKYYLVKFRNRPYSDNKQALQNLVQPIRKRLKMPQSFYDIRIYLDAMEILKECGVDILKFVCSLKRLISKAELSQVEHVYCMFRLYTITHDMHLHICVREGLRNIVPPLINLPNALMLAEILYYKNNHNNF